MKQNLLTLFFQSKATKLFSLVLTIWVLNNTVLSAITITASATGNWSSTGTWTPAQVPTLSDDVIIPSGFNVTVDGTAGTNGNCKTIDIQSGGTLTLGTNYVVPRTSLTCNGTLSASSNAARINTTGAATITILGNFSTLARLQVTSSAGSKVVIDANATVTVSTLGISAGSNLQIDGILTLPTTAATTTQPSGSTVTVNGTFNINGSTFQTAGTVNGTGTIALSPGTSASVTLTTNATTGSISIGTLNLTPNLTSGSVNINNNGSGGSLTATNCNIYGTNVGSLGVSFGPSSAPTSSPNINITNLANNAATTVTFTQNATYGTINNLTINNDQSSRTTNLNTAMSVNNLTITLGRIKLNANNVVLSINSSISGGSSTSFIYTTSSTISGTKVRCTAIPTSGITVPLGGTRYYPVTIVPTATADISVSVMGQIGQSGYATNFTTVALDLTKAVQAEYVLTNNAASSVTVNATFSYGAADYGSAYSATNPKGIAVNTGGAWTQTTGTVGSSSSAATAQTLAASQTQYYGITAEGGLMSNIVLPVELQSFKAKANESVNLLTWSTASEKNNANFQIERSADGANFQTIGVVKGNGTTNVEQYYTFSDETPLSMSYYRLRQTDMNSTETVSKIISVARDKAILVKVYPSVASTVLTIETEETANKATLTVTDMVGRIVLQQKVQSLSSTQLDISNLAKGWFVLEIDRAGKKDKVKFIKQ